MMYKIIIIVNVTGCFFVLFWFFLPVLMNDSSSRLFILPPYEQCVLQLIQQTRLENTKRLKGSEAVHAGPSWVLLKHRVGVVLFLRCFSVQAVQFTWQPIHVEKTVSILPPPLQVWKLDFFGQPHNKCTHVKPAPQFWSPTSTETQLWRVFELCRHAPRLFIYLFVRIYGGCVFLIKCTKCLFFVFFLYVHEQIEGVGCVQKKKKTSPIAVLWK